MVIVDIFERKIMLDTKENIEQLVRLANILQSDFKQGAPPSVLLREVGNVSAVVGCLLQDLTDRMVDEEPCKSGANEPIMKKVVGGPI